MSENPDNWFENYIMDVTEEPMKGELYTYFDGIYFFLCMFHLSCNRFFYFTFVPIQEYTDSHIEEGSPFPVIGTVSMVSGVCIIMILILLAWICR